MSIKYKCTRAHIHETKQVLSILEQLKLNPVYYLKATKAQAHCLHIIYFSAKKEHQSASQSCLFAGTESSFSVRGLNTQNIWRKPNGQATNLKMSRPALDSNWCTLCCHYAWGTITDDTSTSVCVIMSDGLIDIDNRNRTEMDILFEQCLNYYKKIIQIIFCFYFSPLNP